MKNVRRAIVMGALLACAAQPASAKTVIYNQCDGYGTPSGDGDGSNETLPALRRTGAAPEPSSGSTKISDSLRAFQRL